MLYRSTYNTPMIYLYVEFRTSHYVVPLTTIIVWFSWYTVSR